MFVFVSGRVAEVVRRHEGPSPKDRFRTIILSPNIRHFAAILKCRDLRTFLKYLGKNSVFGVKKSVFGQKNALIYGMYCITLS